MENLRFLDFSELSETVSEVSEDDSIFDSDVETSDDEKFAGIPLWQTAFNIAKTIIGEGLLSLPAGLAAGTGIYSGVVIALVFYVVMTYTFWTLGRLCETTGEKTHRGMGDKVTEGVFFGNFMAVANLAQTLSCCVAYALVIGRNAEDVLAPFVSNSWLSSRRGSWVTILIFVLLPLCLLRDLSKLAWASLLGLLCEVGVVSFMIWRFLDGSYSPGGRFYESQTPGLQVAWDETGDPEMWSLSPSTLTLVCSMSSAFLAHYNAPKFYYQLRDRGSRRFLLATTASFTLALVLFLACMTVGYLTFGQHCSGNILHNYSDLDPAATAARFGMLIAVTCGFPLAFTGLRDSVLSLCACSSRRRVWLPLSFALLILIGALGWSLDDLGVLNALGGALLGSASTLVFPGLLLIWAARFVLQQTRVVWDVEVKLVGRVLVAMGGLLMVFGTVVVVVKNRILHKQL
mmetsp:Transcript_46861/g.109438  ORF Transcript_46861/g.109438 Transcript_46861/m.109438 type:complete len:459 (+) Transcript_46861:94-1470(+)